MTSFWIAAIGLTLVAALLLVIGARAGQERQRQAGAPAPNTLVRRQQLESLDRELAAGAILRAEHRAATAEVERSTLEEADSDRQAVSGLDDAPRKPGLVPSSVLGLAVFVFAFGLYGFIGNIDGLQPGPPAVAAPVVAAVQDESTQGVAAMLDDMNTRMAAQREGTVDAAGWALVARSNAALQRFDKAAEAYARARALAPGDAQLLADHADVLAVLQGGRLTGEPAALVARALQIDPANQKALALSAVPAPPVLQISGRIRVSPEMAGRIEPTDEVFVFARAPGSTGMPIAVARYRAASFPLDFKLDASNVVGAPARLAGLSTLVLGARVSRTGDATPRPGDPRGESAPVPLTGAGRDILIEGAVP